MRGYKTWAWSAVLAALVAAPASAQQGTITSGGQPVGGVGLGGGSGLGGGGIGGGLGGGGLGGGLGGGGFGGGGLGGGMGGGGFGAGQQQQMQIGTGGITKPTGQARGVLQASNFLAGYYANPYFQGIANGTQVLVAPGGFGTALYPATGAGGAGGAGGGGRLGAGGVGALGTTALGTAGLGGGRAGGFGGAGAGGLGGAANQSGIVVPLPVPIAYASQPQFNVTPVAPTQIQTEIRTALDNTTMLATPRAVQIITDVNNNVTLRGTVQDAGEARFVEGMVRLTPGVNRIRNELTFPPGK